MVPPIIDEFWASRSAEQHMFDDHEVSLEEAMEAAHSSRRHYRAHEGDPGERRYVVAGRTAEGRRLWVVFADEGGRRGRIVTAFQAGGRKDEARHRRLRGD